MRKILTFLTETLAAVVAIGIVLFMALAWRLSVEPIEATEWTGSIESGLAFWMPNIDVKIDSTLLVWDNEDRSLAFEGRQVTLRDAMRNVIATFPSVKVRLDPIGLLRGRVVPSELALDQASLRFERRADGSFIFGGLMAVEPEDPPTPEQKAEQTSTLQNVAVHLFRELTRKGSLHELSITHAQALIHDETSGQDWMVQIPEMALRHGTLGLMGQAQILMRQGDNQSRIDASYHYDFWRSTHVGEMTLDNFNPGLFAVGASGALAKLGLVSLPLTGKAIFVLDKNFAPLSAQVQIDGDDGRLVDPDLWEAPVPVESLSVKATYDGARDQKLSGKVSLNFGGPTLAVTLDGTPPVDTKDYDLVFGMNVQLANLPMNSFTTVWPKVAVPGAREWIAANMTNGLFTQGTVALKGKLKWSDLENLVLDSAVGKVSARNGRVRYLDGAPPIDGTNADATFDLNHMDVLVYGGGVGGLKLLPSTIQMTDFAQSVQHIVLPIKMAGPADDVLRVIDSPPLGYAKAVGLKAGDIDGRIEGLVDIRLPLLKEIALKDVAIKADAKFIDFASKKLVPGIEISRGQWAFALDDAGFTLKGPAQFNKIPMQLAWQALFAPQAGKPRYQATLTGDVTGEQMKQAGLDLFSKPTGTTAATIRYVQASDSLTQLSGELNFRQAGFVFDMLNWTKVAGTPAVLTFAVDLPKGKTAQVKNIDLQGPQIKVKGTASFDPVLGRLLTAEFKPLMLGRSNATVRFSQPAQGTGPLRFVVEGESFDASGLTSSKESSAEVPIAKDFSLNLGKLYTSDTGFITSFTAHALRDAQGWNEITLHGLADGTHPLDISLMPQLGDQTRRVFSINCDDFGKMLKGLGLTDTVRGGLVSITGQSSADDPRMIEGEATISSFTVSGLPVLMRLLNAVSLFGFADFVAGESTLDRFQGHYRWSGDKLDFQHVRATSSMFGVNIEGVVDLNSGLADLKGTLVPFSLVNRMLNTIPLVGGLLTGGDDQGVFAVAYSVKGALSKPDVSVNPVSLLTPGFLRDLFFGDKKQEKPATP